MIHHQFDDIYIYNILYTCHYTIIYSWSLWFIGIYRSNIPQNKPRITCRFRSLFSSYAKSSVWRLWDAALESARRWIAFEPQSLNPRCAEAFAQAGSQDSEQVKEARVRFAQLYKEVTKLEGLGDGSDGDMGNM